MDGLHIKVGDASSSISGTCHSFHPNYGCRAQITLRDKIINRNVRAFIHSSANQHQCSDKSYTLDTIQPNCSNLLFMASILVINSRVVTLIRPAGCTHISAATLQVIPQLIANLVCCRVVKRNGGDTIR